MTRRANILLAAAIGVFVEGLLCVISVVSVLASIGPCGPNGDPPELVRFIHQPGFLVAGLLTRDDGLPNLFLAVVFTAIILGVMAFIGLELSFGRLEIVRADNSLKPRPTGPGTPTSEGDLPP
jgi:hypothetical protein